MTEDFRLLVAGVTVFLLIVPRNRNSLGLAATS